MTSVHFFFAPLHNFHPHPICAQNPLRIEVALIQIVRYLSSLFWGLIYWWARLEGYVTSPWKDGGSMTSSLKSKKR